MKPRTLALAGILTAALIGPAQAEDLSFLLTNESDVAVTGFYVSHTGTSSWEENLLEGGYLDSGYEIDVIIADGLTTCVYDIRTEFEDGDSFEDYEVDLCDMDGYTFE